ncbi:MAG: hypothetical protein FWE90_03810 [Defluviitaleaceae bacterium]|nr:hypothetical protein [Defluviitaleaceae bacterium]
MQIVSAGHNIFSYFRNRFAVYSHFREVQIKNHFYIEAIGDVHHFTDTPFNAILSTVYQAFDVVFRGAFLMGFHIHC